MITNSRVRSVFDEWAADNAEVVTFLTNPAFDPEDSEFLRDLSRQVRQRRALTPNQVAAVARNIERRRIRAARLTAPVGEGGRRGAAPVGRVTVEGVVAEVDIRPGYRADALDYKMLVDCGEFTVYATVPQALVRDARAADLGLTGARVRFTATLSLIPEQPSRAIGKAPRRVELISAPARSGGPLPARAA